MRHLVSILRGMDRQSSKMLLSASNIIRFILLGLAVFSFVGNADATEGYFRFPALAGESVVFTAEGDLWTAPTGGGRALRLTTHAAQETHAVASPDGKWAAFNASYDGPLEVYVIPLVGGSPKRVTFDGGGDIPLGWAPTGEVLYSTASDDGPTPQRVVAAVDPTTLKRRVLPLADVTDAAIAPNGRTLYFTRFGLATTSDNVRAYRGGMLSRLWRFDLSGSREAELLPPPDEPANERQPMFWGERLYFISDRDGRDNLWSMRLDGGDRRQVTHHKDFSVRSASLDRGRIVYQLGADLHLLDVATGADRLIPIELTSDFVQERRRVVKNPLEFFESASFAPKGDRVVITALGHVATVALPPLRRIDIAIRSEKRLRDAVASPDGRWVFAVLATGDATEIWRFAADGGLERKQLTRDTAAFVTHLWPSPDGKALAFATRDGGLFLLDPDTGSTQLVDTATSGDIDTLVWSSDSRHIAYLRAEAGWERSQLFLYEPETGMRARLTSDRYDSSSPAFTPDGKWLYFLSERTFESRNGAPWGDRNLGPYFDRRSKIYAVALQGESRFPFQPQNELEANEGRRDKGNKEEEKAKGAGTEPKAGPAVEWRGLADRLFEVPLKAGNYRRLATDGKRLYLLVEADRDRRPALASLAIEENALDNEPELATYLEEVGDFKLSADGKKLYLRKWANQSAPGDRRRVGDLFIVDTDKKPPEKLDKFRLPIRDWALDIDAKQQWRQMFADSWLMHRYFFYDDAMRGVDWSAVRSKFAPLADRVTDRDELNDVLAQMSAELPALHSRIRPGDLRSANDGALPGFLGAQLERQTDGYRIAHIYRTDPELPSERAPLSKPGVDAREGDVIVAINGRQADDVADVAELLANQAGKQVLLSLRRDGKELRTVASAIDGRRNDALRYGDWEEDRRSRVEAAGAGRIGYLHLRAMTASDMGVFAREFYAQYDRDALIIDVRRNNGGNIDSWIVEKLLRRAWAVWRPRGKKQAAFNMQQTFRGHLAVLIDERTYSDGEEFAAAVKALHIAPLIGRRTAGAGVWLDDDNPLVDLGMARVAETAQFSLADGKQLVEGVGVEPDIDVENLPNATFKGGDAQLDRAIQFLQDLLKKDPPK